MPDMRSLLKKPIGDVKRPPPLPAGDYPARIKGFEIGNRNKNKTDYVRFHLTLVDWPTDLAEEERGGIELGKRQLKRDFYITDDALWRLTDLIKSCGITYVPGQPIEELVPDLIGQEVTAEVQQYLSEKTGEIRNQIERLFGPEPTEGGE